MGIGHEFGQEKKTKEGVVYKKCLLCGAVMFGTEDIYFNLWCRVASDRREALRTKLQNE